MNKADLIQNISKDTSITAKQASDAIDAFVDAVQKALKKGEHVSIVGFGSWEIRKRAKRNGVNPQTGAKIVIAARRVVKFTPGKDLKSKVA